MKSFALTILAVLLPFVALVGGAAGDGDRHVKAFLNGYQEVVGPGSISTIGEGRFEAKIDRDAQTITYELRYTLENAATVSHIHFAQRHVGGGVIAFLCGGGGKPACPPGTATEAVVTGVITAADIIGPTSTRSSRRPLADPASAGCGRESSRSCGSSPPRPTASRPCRS